MPRIDPLLDEAIAKKASDVHVAPGRPPLARVAGELLTLADAPLPPKDVEEMVDELLAPQQRARLGIDRALAFAHSHPQKEGGPARFRAYVVQHLGGVHATFRLVSRRAPQLADLGAPEVVRRLAERRSGLVVVAGPAGSGKTTTLAAMVGHVNETRACHVVTIEDPIEVLHEPARAQITQREVGVHASSVGAALRNAVRENADVVVVSSLRDKEACAAAIALASSGVAVFAAMPARSVVSAVDRLLASVDDRSVVADALAGVVAQQIVGDIAVHEVLVASPAVATAVRDGKLRELAHIMQSGHAHGMSTFDQAFERLMQGGKLAPERALELAFDKEAFSKVVAKVRPDLVEAPPSA